MTDSQPKPEFKPGDEFHMMIGYCITEWAKVDDELFRIFHNCVGPLEQSAIIYYRTPSLNARLALTDEIVQSVLPKRPKKSGGHHHPSVKAWKGAIDGFCKLLGTRRRIAHQPVSVRYGASWPLSLDLSWILGSPSWFEIYVGQHEQLRPGSELPALKADDLKEHLIAVAALRDRLQQFFSDVLTKRESASPAPSLPQAMEISRQTDLSTKSQRRRKPSPP